VSAGDDAAVTSPDGGDLIAGRYEIREAVGSGGFAAAYRARDRHSGEDVAVKLPNYERSSNDPELIDRYFAKEGDTLDRIRSVGGHPHLMDLVERTAVDGTPVLAVEFVDGYELDTVIDETGPFEESDMVRRIGMNLAAAMGFLHRNEIVYRDLKPDNAMLTDESGTVTLIDFNTATAFDAETRTSADATSILGPYKPPEVADAGSTDVRQGPWSDVYSIGKILMFLLRGTVPKKDGVDPRDFGVDCEPYLAAVIERATRTDYEERYANATVLERVLGAQTASVPAEAAVTHVETDDHYSVFPGDAIGRRDAPGPTPSIAVADEGEYISTVQIQFDVDDDGTWLLRDRSLNGTYVRTGSGWQRILGDEGRRRLAERGEDATDRHGNVPPTAYHLEDGDLIALVHPTYGVSFEFETA
jgi:protein kinase/serine/threonine-protein kinase